MENKPNPWKNRLLLKLKTTNPRNVNVKTEKKERRRRRKLYTELKWTRNYSFFWRNCGI
jgi:hypothetical protein